MELYHAAAGATRGRSICEMGGKNPVIVSRQADLDLAAEGTARSAFGLSGQKCSAASRVYVERPVADAFVERLVARAEGDPRRPTPATATPTSVPSSTRPRSSASSERSTRPRGEGEVLPVGTA